MEDIGKSPDRGDSGPLPPLPGLTTVASTLFQGLTPLAINFRPFGTNLNIRSFETGPTSVPSGLAIMDIAGQLILGLGLFFLGMQQVGENLRRLSGPSFRAMVARSTGSPAETGLLGLVFGALMQSATAVTFILVSMVGSGLIAPRAALPIITWTNVGLTALAFIVTLNIHPLVAYIVGFSAVLASMVRKPAWRAVAGVILGVGLIFFGLETMGGAARPLVATAWFHDLLHNTMSSPAIAFLVGVAVASILQSNTASTLLAITLAGAGAFDLEPAMMLIYGTNLGAISLRLVLAAGMHGTPLQLVRFEDLFCVVSGVIMVALFYVETLAGVPLVIAAVTSISSNLKAQLAWAFLISNLLPALAMSPLLGQCQSLLTWLWPPTAEESEAKPKYITHHALKDPGTAMDLLEREIARLVDGIAGLLKGGVKPDERHKRAVALGQLAATINGFASQLSSQSLSAAMAGRLALLREESSFAGYLRENVEQLDQSITPLAREQSARPAVDRVNQAAAHLLDMASKSAASLDEKDIGQLRSDTRQGSTFVSDVEQSCLQLFPAAQTPERAALIQSLDALKMVAWVSHRLAKVLSQLATYRAAGTV